jgi:hypothetical protein
MLNLADRLSLSARFWSAEFPSISGKHLRLLLRDGEYSHKAPLTKIKAQFIEKLLGEKHSFKKILQGVVENVIDIAQQGTISHLVIYGKNRIQVLTSIICNRDITENFPIVLSENAIAREVLIAERIGNKLSPDDIRSLPDVLDFPCNATLVVPPELLEKLYVSGRLIQPYQIDTERYPFTGKYI